MACGVDVCGGWQMEWAVTQGDRVWGYFYERMCGAAMVSSLG